MNEKPAQTKAKLKALLAPRHFSDALLEAIRRALASLTDFYDEALLLRADYETGTSGFLIVLTGVDPRAEPHMTDIVDGIVAETGKRDLQLDVTFLESGDASLGRLRQTGLVLTPLADAASDAEGPTFSSFRGRRRNRL